jgi:hypothetical protein
VPGCGPAGCAFSWNEKAPRSMRECVHLWENGFFFSQMRQSASVDEKFAKILLPFLSSLNTSQIRDTPNPTQ